jgi:hypothetical protein
MTTWVHFSGLAVSDVTVYGVDCRSQVESSAFRRVTDIVICLLSLGIPSTVSSCIAATRQDGPFGAQPRRGLDGARPPCREHGPGMREWQALLWRVV